MVDSPLTGRFNRRTGLIAAGAAGLAGLAACTTAKAAADTTVSSAGITSSAPPTSSAAAATVTSAPTSAPTSVSTAAAKPTDVIVAPVSGVDPGTISAVPIPPGQVDAAIGHLDAIAAMLMKRSGIPGLAIAVVHGGKTVYAKGFGVRELGKPATIDADTVFQLASLSKPIASTVVARQVTKKQITWDTSVVKYLPWFKLIDPYVTAHLTIGDCFAHRSGLGPQSGDTIEDFGYDRREVLTRLRYLPLRPFRISYAYTNWGLTAGAEAVAVASGLSWDALSERDLYKPLGMTSTSSNYADYRSRPNRAVGHAVIDGRYEARFVRQPDPESPSGGVSSSVNDVAKWLAVIVADGAAPHLATGGQPFIDPAALGPAISPQMVSNPPHTPDARAGHYGFGWNVSVQASGRVQTGHSGAFALGAGTNVAVLPSADVAIVALTNAAPTGVAEAMSASFLDIVQYGAVQRDWYAFISPKLAGLRAPIGSLVGKKPPATPLSARPVGSYVGIYTNETYGRIEVTATGSRLTMLLGPHKLRHPMTHWSADEFTIAFEVESAPYGSISAVTFAGPKSPAPSVVVELLDEEKLGTFLRVG